MDEVQDLGRKTLRSDTGLHFYLVRGQNSPITPQSQQLVPALTLWENITRTLLTQLGKQKKR